MYRPARRALCQCVDFQLKRALQVGCFVVVDDVFLGQFVEHGYYFGQQSFGSGFVGRIAQCFHGVTSGFVVVFVVQTTRFGLTDTFFG